jgi:tetratricopeptide (TPR) repeat protein
VPLFALSALSCVVTIFAQKAGGAVAPLDDIPLGIRMVNALVAYAGYLWHLLWPEQMAVLYPYAGKWPLIHIAGALAVLLGLTGLAWWQRRRRPYLLAGWAWYVGTLVPVIGLVQVGNQSMADRYTYIPAIGLFLALAWVGAESIASRPTARWAAWAGAAAVLIACVITSQAQLLHWHNTDTLFRHALAVTTNNYVAANDLGFYYADQRAPELAKKYYRLAIQMNPKYQHAYNNLGCVLIDQGRLTEAKTNLEAALKLDPTLADAYSNLGTVCFRLGQQDEAIDRYREALRLRPNYALAHHNLANVLAGKNQIQDAEQHYREALRLNRFAINAHLDLASMLVKVGRFDEAAVQYQEALTLQPDSRRAHYELGDMLAKQSKLDAAAAHFSELLRLQPHDSFARYRLANVRGAQGKAAEAATLYREVLRAQPDFAEALNNLAWLLAANPDPQVRNGSEAVEIAERACKLTESKEPVMIGTLAAAYAEAGRFPEAIATAEQARLLAEKNHLPEVAAKNLQLLQLYRAGQPYRDTPGK